MTIPYRTFYKKHINAFHYEGHDSDKADFEAVHSEVSRLRRVMNTGPVLATFSGRYFVVRGDPADGWNAPGADKLCDVEVRAKFLPLSYNVAPITAFTLYWGYFYDDLWDSNLATGQTIDGVQDWAHYPPSHYGAGSNNYIANRTFSVADLPETRGLIYEAWDHYTDTCLALDGSPYILDGGLFMRIASTTPTSSSWWPTWGLALDVEIETIIVRYFNATCNSFSRYSGPSAGGWPLVLTGMGLLCDDVEIAEKSGPGNQGHVFDAWVYNIFIEKLDGTIVHTFRGYHPYHEYSLDSDTQITIPSMPALAPGVYQVRLHKHIDSDAYIHQIDAYAGDWRTDPDGRMTPGQRLYLWIYDSKTPPKKPIIRGKWTWKKGDLTIFKYYAPIDVRTPSIFYEGLILGISDFTRGVNDTTGLPLFPDVEVTLDNTSLEFSKLLAEYWVKNQIIELWFGYQEEPDLYKETVFRGVVTDYDKPGSTWRVKAHDIMEKYFAVKVPRYLVTETNYPNVHKNHLGKEMPEVLGLASLTTGSAPGAVEAIYVDTTTYKYLCARGSLYNVDEVYVDGVLKNPADYTVSYEDGGITYITFGVDQGDAKVTFNCRGYSYADWDDPESDGGFVMNPAYIILFTLAFFAEVPDIFVDIPAFEDLADYYQAGGFGRSGYLILQSQKDLPAVLQELLFTYGAKLWTRTDGKITIGRKDIADFQTSLFYREQIDALEEPDRPTGLGDTVNYANVRWEHYPSLNQSMRAKVVSRPSSITDYEAVLMPGKDWDFLWTADELLVDMRTTEDLLRFGYGNQTLGLTIGLEHIDDLDVLDNFRFQDPFGLHPLGLGEEGRYFYAERLTYGLLTGRMKIDGVDLQWAIRQACCLGDETLIALTWAAATQYDRMFCYLCDELTGLFADGEPGKALVSE